jgi:paraquat-inducible protein B
LSKNRESIRSAACEHIQSTATREVSLPEMTFPTWNDCSVYIQAEVMDYTILQDHIDPNLHTQLKDVKLKKKVAKIEDLLEDFDVSSRNLTTGFADRKSIVRDYIHKKYPNEAEKYLEELRNMKII